MLRDQGRSLAGDCFSSRREAETKNKTLVGREPKGRDDPRQADSETRITMKSVIINILTRGVPDARTCIYDICPAGADVTGRLGSSPSRLGPRSIHLLFKMKTSERGGGLLPVLKHSFFHCFSIFSPHGIYYKVLPAHCFLNISVNISKQESKVLAVLLKAASPQH